MDESVSPWPIERAVRIGRFPLRDDHAEDDVWANSSGNDVASRVERPWEEERRCHLESPCGQAGDACLATSLHLPWQLCIPAHQPNRLLRQTTYYCPLCGQTAWAKPTAQLLCGVCQRPMQASL